VKKNFLVTPNEVLLAYRLFLGREPENDDVVKNLCQSVHSIDQLRIEFYKSSEFLKRMGEILDSPKQVMSRHPFNLPAIPVAVQCSNERLDKMFERIAAEWSSLGKEDPYWSVITQPQYHLDQFESHREQFFNSGSHISNLLLASLRRCGINPNILESCLDFGCGVGRVSAHLAKIIPKVIGVDISKPHLDLAKSFLESINNNNVELIHLEHANMVQSLPQVDLVLSVITLQHNPPPVIYWLIKNLLGLLKSGGVAFIQVPTYKNGYIFEIEHYLNTPAPNTLEMHFLPQSDVFRAIEESNCACLEVREDGMVGHENLMLSNSFVIQKN
jgi:SAM-dependent methyltransferase